MNSFVETLENRLLFYTALPAMPSVQNTDQPVRFAAAADFNGDGRADILTRNYSTGANTIYLTNSVDTSGAGFSIANIKATPNTDWWVAGVGDWNADGKSDILWRNDSTGQVYLMLMNGTAVASAAMVYVEPNLAWKIVATGDYDGNGKSDLLWRNDTTGQVWMQLMNGTAIASQGGPYNEPNTAWKLLGAWEYAQ